MKKALIIGVSGQDGAYLANLLISKGYEVWGSSRNIEKNNFFRLEQLGINENVKKINISLNDYTSVLKGVETARPNEIYNLSGQSSVGISFISPLETTESILNGLINILEVIRKIDKKIKIYNAGSSEIFGETYGDVANEMTQFKPRSPYAIAKAAGTWIVEMYRKNYGLYACTGILFNHESILRPEIFVTKKIICAACRIALGGDERLEIGNTKIRRDWGWAPEYVDAMNKILSQNQPSDYVICTGITQSLQEFIEVTFDTLGLDWERYVTVNSNLYRENEPLEIRGSAENAKKYLQWEPKYSGSKLIKKLVKEEMNFQITKKT